LCCLVARIVTRYVAATTLASADQVIDSFAVVAATAVRVSRHQIVDELTVGATTGIIICSRSDHFGSPGSIVVVRIRVTGSRVPLGLPRFLSQGLHLIGEIQSPQQRVQDCPLLSVVSHSFDSFVRLSLIVLLCITVIIVKGCRLVCRGGACHHCEQNARQKTPMRRPPLDNSGRSHDGCDCSKAESIAQYRQIAV